MIGNSYCKTSLHCLPFSVSKMLQQGPWSLQTWYLTGWNDRCMRSRVPCFWRKWQESLASPKSIFELNTWVPLGKPLNNDKPSMWGNGEHTTCLWWNWGWAILVLQCFTHIRNIPVPDTCKSFLLSLSSAQPMGSQLLLVMLVAYPVADEDWSFPYDLKHPPETMA